MSTTDNRLKTLGNNIQSVRKSKGISQINLAIKLGITREHLSKIERGAAYPSVKILLSIVDILKIELKNIITF